MSTGPMSRFKFVCDCGKRLAAYDWQVGRIVTCPSCGKTLTIPTPFQAEAKLHDMIDKGYNPSRRKIGIPVNRKALRKRILLFGAVVLGIAAASVLLYYIIF